MSKWLYEKGIALFNINIKTNLWIGIHSRQHWAFGVLEKPKQKHAFQSEDILFGFGKNADLLENFSQIYYTDLYDLN